MFVKNYRFLSFPKNMGRNIGKNIIKNLNNKCCKNPLYHAKQSTTGALKTSSKKAIQKTQGATGHFIGNKITDQITKISKTSLHDNLKGVTNEEKERRKTCFSRRKTKNY